MSSEIPLFRRSGRLVAVCGCVLAGVAARPAAAALGDTVSSVARDQVAMRGTLSVTRMQSFDVHQLVDAHGQTVREYADRAGNIFAVTWNGRRSPDLKQLLGAYYGRYVVAAALHKTGHHVLSIHTPELALSIVRAQRSAFGRAYLPARLPGGVTRAELR
ncbi:MAG: DUF2844 domain-containing protein [Gammaproteobacteria bacterium]|nr:DUF2844 domain-containing protein [Gammaproteobacteria bacterium]